MGKKTTTWIHRRTIQTPHIKPQSQTCSKATALTNWAAGKGFLFLCFCWTHFENICCLHSLIHHCKMTIKMIKTVKWQKKSHSIYKSLSLTIVYLCDKSPLMDVVFQPLYTCRVFLRENRVLTVNGRWRKNNKWRLPSLPSHSPCLSFSIPLLLPAQWKNILWSRRLRENETTSGILITDDIELQGNKSDNNK